MSYSSGTFSLFTPGNPVVTGTTIASTWANNTLNDVATGLSTCVLKDGSQTITANIPMSSFKITGLGAPTTAGDALAFGSAGTVTTLTATTSVVTPLVTQPGTLTLQTTGSNPLIFQTNGVEAGRFTPAAILDLTAGASQLKTSIVDSGSPGSLSLKTNNGTAQVTIANSGTTGIGGATPAATGKGITFPASQSSSVDANTLDDYVEGSWTPSVGGNATYALQLGQFIKIGGMVFIQGNLVINAIGTGSTTTISGLPKAAGSIIGGGVVVTSSQSLASTVVSIAGDIGASASSIVFRSRTAAAASDGANAVFGNGANIFFSGSYSFV